MRTETSWLTDVNTLQRLPRETAVNDSAEDRTPIEFAEWLVEQCERRLDPKLFPNGRPQFRHEEADLGDGAWEVTVAAVYERDCPQGLKVAKRLGGKATMQTALVIVRAKMIPGVKLTPR